MQFESFDHFLAWCDGNIGKGPFAFIFAEDSVGLQSTVDHHSLQGFRKIFVFGDTTQVQIFEDDAPVYTVEMELPISGDIAPLMNQIIPKIEGQWAYYCYNGEYLYYPFCESRTIGEMIAFNMEERRDTVMTFVVDLYAPDLWEEPSGVDIHNAHLDKSGYYALDRKDEWNNSISCQMDFYGGLRWRFEEHVHKDKRRIDRVSIFRAVEGLQLRSDFTFNLPDYNTYACPWHNNITGSVCSFRAAKALKRNPGSTFDIQTFYWHNSVQFEWSSQQLMDLGLMEPGQWF